MRTVVSSGNDALNILFEAATVHENSGGLADGVDSIAHRDKSGNITSHGGSATGLNGDEAHIIAPCSPISKTHSLDKLSNSTEEVLRIWETCRFVRMGWFTAREAVTYIDLLVKLHLIEYVVSTNVLQFL